MSALCKTDDAQPCAQCEGASNAPAASARRLREECHRDEIESDRRIPGGERAIARALIAWHESRAKRLVATEGGNLCRSGAAPMVFENGVDGKTRAQRERQQQKKCGLSVKA